MLQVVPQLACSTEEGPRGWVSFQWHGTMLHSSAVDVRSPGLCSFAITTLLNLAVRGCSQWGQLLMQCRSQWAEACSVSHWCVQANKLIQGCHAVVAALPHCVPNADQSSAQLGTPDESVAEVQAACNMLVAQHRQLMQSSGPHTSLADLAEQTQQLVQPAARLGSMLVELDRSPALSKERRLVLARAAATRSCAYLGCANVAGQGGPAAGKGEGSARCR